jgi:hypothetical protein
VPANQNSIGCGRSRSLAQNARFDRRPADKPQTQKRHLRYVRFHLLSFEFLVSHSPFSFPVEQSLPFAFCLLPCSRFPVPYHLFPIPCLLPSLLLLTSSTVSHTVVTGSRVRNSSSDLAFPVSQYQKQDPILIEASSSSNRLPKIGNTRRRMRAQNNDQRREG